MTSTQLTEFGADGAVAIDDIRLSDGARAFAAASLSRNTKRAYTAQWKLWSRHCEAEGISPLPAARPLKDAALSKILLPLIHCAVRPEGPFAGLSLVKTRNVMLAS